MSWGNQVISQTHLPSGSPAACLFIRSPLLIADHTSYVTSPRILQVNLARAAQSTHGEGTRTSVISHTLQHGSDGWHGGSCTAPNGLLKWLIKGKQLLCGGTDGAAPPTEAGTPASEGEHRGARLSAGTLSLSKLALITVMERGGCKSHNQKLVKEKDRFPLMAYHFHVLLLQELVVWQSF